MKTTLLHIHPEALRAANLGSLSENARQMQDTLVHAWSRLDSGWEDYSESGIQATYHEAMGEVSRMIAMLEQMDEALLQTADKIETADHGAVTLFSFDSYTGGTPGTPSLPPGYTTPGSSSNTPPGDNVCPIPGFPILAPNDPFTLGYTTPLPGSSTLIIPNSYWGLPDVTSQGQTTTTGDFFLEDYFGYSSTGLTIYDLILQARLGNSLLAGGFRLTPGSTYAGQVIVYGSHDAKSLLGLSPYLTHMRGVPPGLVTTPGTAALRAVSGRLTAAGLGIVYGVDIYQYAWGDKSNVGVASSEFVSTITTDTVITLGPPAAGAAIGTAICPVVGTIVGGVIGLGVSVVWGVFGREGTISWVDDNIFSPLGNFLFNAPPSKPQVNEHPPVPKPTPTTTAPATNTPTPTPTSGTSTPTLQVTPDPTITPQPKLTPSMTPTPTPTTP